MKKYLSKRQAFLIYNIDVLELENQKEDEYESDFQLAMLRQQRFIRNDVFNQITEQKWLNFFLR